MTAQPTTFPAAPDHDAEYRPAMEDVDDGFGNSTTFPEEDGVGWDLHFGARLTFADDQEFADGRGLHFMLSIGPDMPKGGLVVKTVTPRQLRRFAEDLLLLARRAEDRRGVTS